MKTNRRAMLSIAGVVLLISSAAWAHTNVTPEQARDLIASTEDLLVVDVRERSEYCDAAGHIPGALNYPLSSGVLYARYEELPMDRPLLVVCRSGGRSNSAANFLDSKGFGEVYDMLGGMNAWLWETAPCKYDGGSGTPDDPYQIATATDLIALGADPNDHDKHFILTADIDLDPNLPGGQVFAGALIASDMSTSNNFQGTAFSGTFDGNGYTIANLTIDAGTGEYLGLFGSVTGMAVIDGVTLEGADVTGRKYVSGLIGYNAGTVSDCQVTCRLQGEGFAPWRFGGLAAFNVGSIHNCHVTGEIFTLDSSGYFGGLVGGNEGPITDSRAHVDIAGGAGCWEIGALIGENRAPVTNCHAAGNVTGGDGCRFLGGLVGVNYDTILTNCSATGDVSAGFASNRVAGLVAGNPNGTIAFCYATGDVTAGDSSSELGGLAGDNFGTITDCWTSGNVSASLKGSSVGGLIGRHGGSAANSYVTAAVSAGDDAQYVGALIGRGSGSVDGCFWDEETSGPIGSASGQGRTTSQMQTAGTFLEAGWDFAGEAENGVEEIWWIDEGRDYPRLWWEPRKYGGGTGEPNDPYLIYTAAHLNALGAEPNDYDKHFKLMADIDLAGYSYDRAVIAPDTNDAEPSFQGTPFTGVFDGGGRTIANLTIVCRETLPGLFGRLGAEARVMDFRIVDVNITDVHMGMAGMLAAQSDGLVANIYASGTVSAGSEVGGLVGSNGGSVIACCTAGNIDAIKAVGGLAGRNQGTVENSCSIAVVNGRVMFAGLVGDNDSGSVSSCYSAGPVINTSLDVGPDEPQGMGGLVGRNRGRVADSFWDVETSGRSTSDGGVGVTTAEMQTAGTFLEAGWDFVGETDNGTEDIWWIDEGQDYPRLWWESADAEF